MKADGYLVFEDGQVTLNNTLLPGILVSQSINCEVSYDEFQLDGMSGTVKLAQGWNDSIITLSIDLLCGPEVINNQTLTTCYQKLRFISDIFKKAKSYPKIYEVFNRHMHARGITQVIFDKLYSHETDQDDVMAVDLCFTEHNPPVIKREIRNNASMRNISKPNKVLGAPRINYKTQPTVSTTIVKDDTSLIASLIAGFKAGFK